jgi:hypothetical protein
MMAAEWIYPQDERPPEGEAIFRLAPDGKASVGAWTFGFIAWQRLFARNVAKEFAYIEKAMPLKWD